MKWFKHMADASDDSFIQALEDRFGHFGYAGYFKLLEIYAKETGNNPAKHITVSESYLMRKLRKRSREVHLFLNFCSTSGKLLLNFSEKKFIISIPKFAEIKDNYTKDLQATGKFLSKNLPTEEEADIRVKNKN